MEAASTKGSAAGLGSVRTLAAFQEAVGVDYSSKQISPAAVRGSQSMRGIEFACDSMQADLSADSEHICEGQEPKV